MTDRWLGLDAIAVMLGLSTKSLLRLRRRGLPLRQVSPRGGTGALESELLVWIKKQPRSGKPVQEAVKGTDR